MLLPCIGRGVRPIGWLLCSGRSRLRVHDFRRAAFLMLKALEDVPRFMFFAGKGGVGKTSLACASAVALADAGRRVLLTSTDPASNVCLLYTSDAADDLTRVDLGG